MSTEQQKISILMKCVKSVYAYLDDVDLYLAENDPEDLIFAVRDSIENIEETMEELEELKSANTSEMS